MTAEEFYKKHYNDAESLSKQEVINLLKYVSLILNKRLPSKFKKGDKVVLKKEAYQNDEIAGIIMFPQMLKVFRTGYREVEDINDFQYVEIDGFGYPDEALELYKEK
jgi:hypothetical protein